MSWVVELTVPADESAIIADELWRLGPSGVAEVPQEEGVGLIAGFESEAAARSATDDLSRFSPTCSHDCADWSGPEVTMIVVGSRTMRIDAGHAFGHGSHPTTALLLDWLQEVGVAGRSVLDVGTGTGVLAIAASMLGATSVVGIDNDPAAIESAGLNMDQNDVSFELSDQPVGQRDAPADIVVANMLLPDLLGVAQDLKRLTQTTLLISGVINTQVTELTTALAPLALVETRADGPWRALRLERP